MRVTFDEFVFDTNCRQLDRNGEPVHLQPKAFQLLQYLIEAAPAAISHAHLYDLLWGETHVVEANLRNLVADIRAALGDGRRDARFIRTVHGFGYRFIAAPSIDSHPYRADLLLEGAMGRYPLNQGPNIVGHDPSADVRIDHPGVSRVHAAIVICGDETWIENRDPEHETWVGGDPVIGSARIRAGDTIRIGPVTLSLKSRSIVPRDEGRSAADSALVTM